MDEIKPLGNKTILLVEDEAIIALSEARTLAQFGYKVITANSGEAAIEIMENKNTVDLVLMDIDLGEGFDGTQTAEIILRNHDIPLVFLSCHTEPEIVNKTEKITSYGYVVKNSGPTVLDASIKMAFKLFEANQKNKAIVRAFPDLMFVVDRDGYFRDYVIGSNTPALAVPEEMIIGSHLRDVYPPEDVAFHLNLYNQCIETGRVQEHAYRLNIRGQDRYFDLRISRLDRNHVLAVIRDITDREKSDLELRKLSHAIEQSSSIVVITDKDGNIEYGNPKFTEATGYTLEEVKGRNPRFLKSGIVSSKVYVDLWNTITSGKTWHGSFVNKKKNGEIFYENANISPVKNREGEITNFIAVKEDISGRKKAEIELLRNQTLLNEMGKMAKVGGWSFDIEKKELRWTDECYSIYEVDATFFPTVEKVLNFYVPESRELLAREIAWVMETGGEYNVEGELITAKGNRRRVRSIGKIEFKNGIPAYRIGVTQDITDLKKTEKELRESEEKYRLLIENNHDIIYSLTSQGIFSFVSPAWTTLVGHSVSEVVNKPFQLFVHPEDVEACLAWLRLLVESGRRQEGIVYRVRHTDGSWRWHTSSGVPLKGETGMVTGFVGIARDITEWKLTAEKLKSLMEEKELLLREFQHRIKNNMNTMISLLSLQINELKDPNAVRAVMDARGRFQSLGVLYDRLNRSDSLNEMSAAAYLSNLIEEIVKLFPRNINISVEKSIDEFSLTIKDLSTLGIIVNELITNILKYAFKSKPDGRISVSASKSGKNVHIEIGDNGIGMPESIDMENSTGLGLMLVGTLTKQLNGTIRIERREGTRFILEFPAGGKI